MKSNPTGRRAKRVTGGEGSAAASGSQRKMPKGTPFPKGVSGNPSGMPKRNLDFRDACREFMDAEGWERMKARARTDDAMLSLVAAYAYGRPSQKLEHTGSDGGPIQLEPTGSLLGKLAGLIAAERPQEGMGEPQ